MTAIALDQIHKSFGDTKALNDFSLSVDEGELVAVTGPSGAGKTTLCRLISGIDVPDSGSISFAGTKVNDWPAHGREIAHMFESFALYPQWSVFDNVAFPLRAPGRSLSDHTIRDRVEEILSLTDIAHLADRLPQALSGGQKQRVALCRALVQSPRGYVLDEPISHLDAKLRNRLRGDIRRRLHAGGRPAIWCTPDAMEAIAIADRVVVMVAGEIQQIGTPETIYFEPANTQVAKLVGDPTMNLIAGRIQPVGENLSFETSHGAIPLPAGLLDTDKIGRDDLVLGIRPTRIGLSEDQNDRLPAEVYAWEPFGKYAIITAKFGDDFIRVKHASTTPFAIGQPLSLAIDPTGLALFDGKNGRALSSDLTISSTTSPNTLVAGE